MQLNAQNIHTHIAKNVLMPANAALMPAARWVKTSSRCFPNKKGAGLIFTASTGLANLLGGLNVCDGNCSSGLLGLKFDFVADLEILQHGDVLDAEDHGHAGHVEIFNHAMFERDFFIFLV